MTDLVDAEAQKRSAAIAAVAHVEHGMLIGLGTGTTAAYAIEEVGRRVREGLHIRAVATSMRTAQAALAAGIAVVDMAEFATIDLAIDGVDEIDPAFVAIKGGGGAMLREKIVASAARRMIGIADASKLVERLGKHPVPLEVLPMAAALVLRRVLDLGCQATIRLDAGAPYRTDQGNHVIDCHFATISDPARLSDDLSRIPGVLGHGLFLAEIGTMYVATQHGIERRDRPHNL
jgi:ribose 5-phosphate isomerase A